MNISFQNKDKQTLRGFVYTSFFNHTDTAILFLHGFPGHSAGTARRFCRALSLFGYTAIGFDFSGSDTSDGQFENKLMSKEVEDIKYAIGGYKRDYFGFCINKSVYQ